MNFIDKAGVRGPEIASFGVEHAHYSAADTIVNSTGYDETVRTTGMERDWRLYYQKGLC